MNLPQIQRILQEFEKQSEVMDMKEEVMNDAMDDAMDDEADEEETYDKIILLFVFKFGLKLLENTYTCILLKFTKLSFTSSFILKIV